jgi:MerR family redox-sensitive transcriptional activator SoxR
VRYYESAGLLPQPRRRSGRRIYDPSVLRWLGLIALAQRAGFSIRDIRTLLHGFGRRTPPSKRWKTLASRKLDEVRAQIDQARSMERVLTNLLRCECPTLEDCGGGVIRSAQ